MSNGAFLAIGLAVAGGTLIADMVWSCSGKTSGRKLLFQIITGTLQLMIGLSALSAIPALVAIYIHAQRMGDLIVSNGPCNPCDLAGMSVVLAAVLALVIAVTAQLIWWARHRDFHYLHPNLLNHNKNLQESTIDNRYCRNDSCYGRRAWYQRAQ